MLNMQKYRCTICWYIYNPKDTDISFEDLTDDWVCPICKAPKDLFKKYLK